MLIVTRNIKGELQQKIGFHGLIETAEADFGNCRIEYLCEIEAICKTDLVRELGP
jgi:hypothetical protein